MLKKMNKKSILDIIGGIFLVLTVIGFILFYVNIGNIYLGMSLIGIGGIFVIVFSTWRITISISDSRKKEEPLKALELIINILWGIISFCLLAFDLYILIILIILGGD